MDLKTRAAAIRAEIVAGQIDGSEDARDRIDLAIAEWGNFGSVEIDAEGGVWVTEGGARPEGTCGGRWLSDGEVVQFDGWRSARPPEAADWLEGEVVAGGRADRPKDIYSWAVSADGDLVATRSGRVAEESVWWITLWVNGWDAIDPVAGPRQVAPGVYCGQVRRSVLYADVVAAAEALDYELPNRWPADWSANRVRFDMTYAELRRLAAVPGMLQQGQDWDAVKFVGFRQSLACMQWMVIV